MGMKLIYLKKLVHLVIPFTLIIALVLGAGCIISPNLRFSTSMNQPAKPALGNSNIAYPPEMTEVFAKVRPSVVTVNTEQLAGSGWILSANGLIVTNNHVVEGAKNVTVTLLSGQTFKAGTILTDAIDDLAVIDIGVNDLPAAELGDSSKIRVGDWVVAMGNAQGEGILTTQGKICSIGSTFKAGEKETLYNTLGTNASITYGNSGGPLVNMDGEVIGIVTAAELTRFGTQVAGYAVSSNTAQKVINDLLQRGRVSRAWLGVNGSSVSDLPTGGRTFPEKGAFLVQVVSESPAGKAGLKAGDIITSFGRKDIYNVGDLVTAVRKAEPGQQVIISYWRDKIENTTDVILLQDPDN